MEQKLVASTKSAVNNLLNLAKIGDKRLWIDYDKEADVLYINFDNPKKADQAKENNGIITRTRKGKVIGLTFLNASSFSKKSSN